MEGGEGGGGEKKEEVKREEEEWRLPWWSRGAKSALQHRG